MEQGRFPAAGNSGERHQCAHREGCVKTLQVVQARLPDPHPGGNSEAGSGRDAGVAGLDGGARAGESAQRFGGSGRLQPAALRTGARSQFDQVVGGGDDGLLVL